MFGLNWFSFSFLRTEADPGTLANTHNPKSPNSPLAKPTKTKGAAYIHSSNSRPSNSREKEDAHCSTKSEGTNHGTARFHRCFLTDKRLRGKEAADLSNAKHQEKRQIGIIEWILNKEHACEADKPQKGSKGHNGHAVVAI